MISNQNFYVVNYYDYEFISAWIHEHLTFLLKLMTLGCGCINYMNSNAPGSTNLEITGELVEYNMLRHCELSRVTIMGKFYWFKTT
jgi:hypothetical protein